MKMKKNSYLVLIIVALLFASALPAQARERDYGHSYSHRHSYSHGSSYGGVWGSPGWGGGWGWGPWWWGVSAYPYYYSNYYGEPPVVYQEESPLYVEPTPQAEEQTYWYYCPESRNYYPYVKKCPNGWMKVVPTPAPPDYEE